MISELRELQRLTGDDRGAWRVAWTPVWARARDWLKEKLAELNVEVETDPVGNLSATLAGRRRDSVILSGHIDSVPAGGWLDGALNVLAALEVLRSLSTERDPPAATVRLVDWADEEGARFGQSLFGSRVACGTLNAPDLSALKDAEGVTLAEATAAHGVKLERAGDAAKSLTNARACLELHIEQGPVLEQLGLPLGAVLGTYGTQRHEIRFTGESGHAGGTPMEVRRDSLQAAARLVGEVRDIALRHQGLSTVAGVDTQPDVGWVIQEASIVRLDQRHADKNVLDAMVATTLDTARRIAEQEGMTVDWQTTWAIEPIAFAPELIALADQAIESVAGRSHRLFSGPLHDAAEVCRSGVPTAMIFVQSLGGISHRRDEDTRVEDLALAVRAFEHLVRATVEWVVDRP